MLMQEATPLRDTATTVRGVRRKPTDGQIFPIGHIALAIHEPESDAKLGLTSEGVVVSTFVTSEAPHARWWQQAGNEA